LETKRLSFFELYQNLMLLSQQHFKASAVNALLLNNSADKVLNGLLHLPLQKQMHEYVRSAGIK
jgi:hypothetical protein